VTLEKTSIAFFTIFCQQFDHLGASAILNKKSINPHHYKSLSYQNPKAFPLSFSQEKSPSVEYKTPYPFILVPVANKINY
jgi:hypothetical protein